MPQSVTSNLIAGLPKGALESRPGSRRQKAMSFVSYLEDITDRAYDNWHMRGADHQPKPEPAPIIIVTSPPLQPDPPAVVVRPSPRLDPASAADRKRSQHEKHILALYELLPGNRWRQ